MTNFLETNRVDNLTRICNALQCAQVPLYLSLDGRLRTGMGWSAKNYDGGSSVHVFLVCCVLFLVYHVYRLGLSMFSILPEARSNKRFRLSGFNFRLKKSIVKLKILHQMRVESKLSSMPCLSSESKAGYGLPMHFNFLV